MIQATSNRLDGMIGKSDTDIDLDDTDQIKQLMIFT
jgi:hypothetical protein